VSPLRTSRAQAQRMHPRLGGVRRAHGDLQTSPVGRSSPGRPDIRPRGRRAHRRV